MDAYLVREPILDRRWNVAGYELLFHSSEPTFRDLTNGLSVASELRVNRILSFGLDRLFKGTPAFIHFDRALLLSDWTNLLPPDKVVVEICPSVGPDPEILTVCEKLRHEGYAIALGGCRDDARTEEFAPSVDILKVNFQLTALSEQERVAAQYRKFNLRLVAEKITSDADFSAASRLNYDYIQGFFFASQSVLQATRVPASYANCLRLMQEMQREEMNLVAVEDVIRRDIAFSHSLLKYLNSAAFRRTNPVESVRQGLTLLGANEVRRWAWMASLSSLVQNRPPVLLAHVLMRGRFCEVIAESAKMLRGDSDPFLLGILSLLGAILQKPLEAILDELSIGWRIRNALLGTADESDPLALVLRIAQSYEAGEWSTVASTRQILGVSAEALSTCYMESLCWVDAASSADEQTWHKARPSAEANFRCLTEIRTAVGCQATVS